MTRNANGSDFSQRSLDLYSSFTTDKLANSCKRTVCMVPSEGKREREREESIQDRLSLLFTEKDILFLPGSARQSHFRCHVCVHSESNVTASEPVPISCVSKGINRGAFSCSLKDPHSGDKRAEPGKQWISIRTAFRHCLQLAFGDLQRKLPF